MTALPAWRVLLVLVFALALFLAGVVLGRLVFRRQLGRYLLQLDGQSKADARAGKPTALVEGPGVTAAARAVSARFVRG